MNFFAISPLISSILFISLGLFVFLKNPNSRANQVFGLMCLVTFWWQFSWFILFSFGTEQLAKVMVHVGYTGIIFIPYTFYHFFVIFLKKDKEKFLVLCAYLLGFIFLFFNWISNFYINDYYKYSWGYYPRAGLLHPVYLLSLFLIAGRITYLLYGELAKSKLSPIRYNQIKYILCAFVIYTFASSDFIVNYGIGFYPLGFIAISIFLSITAYAIVRHRLLDIELVIRRVVIFTGIFSFIFGIFATITFIAKNWFSKVSGASEILSSAISIAIIIFLYDPIRNLFKNLTDKFFFQKEYDHQELLKEISKDMVDKIDLDELKNFITYSLLQKMKLENIAIIDKESYSDVVLLNWHRTNTELLLYEEISYLSKERKKDLAPLKDKMHQLKVAVSIPIFSKDVPFWVLLLGDKKSGRMYSNEDTDMLEALSHEIAIAIENAINFQELKRSQMELLRQENLKFVSVLVKGLAHEILNPLTPLMHKIEDLEGENLLKLYEVYENNKSKLDKDEEVKFKESILTLRELTVSLKNNANHIRLIVDTLNKLEKGDDKTIGPVDIKTFFKEVVTIFGVELDSKLQQGVVVNQNIERNLPPIKGNPTLLKQVIINLYKNSCEAMKDSNVKTVDISCKVNEINPGEMLIEFSDTGPGIPKEIIPRLFMYGATTKGSKGSGIGLNQGKAIIEKFGGSIRVISEKGQGTKFIITLPIWNEKMGVNNAG